MATFLSGKTHIDTPNGSNIIGTDEFDVSGIGSLTVEGGSSLDLTAANLATLRVQALIVGDAAGASATVTIDAASSISFGNALLDDTASELIVGRNGGTGTMQITGGTFQIADASTVAVDVTNDYDDEEIVIIGKGTGSAGTLGVSAAGSFLVTGNSVFMQIGRDGGTGSASFSGGSHFNLTAGGVGSDGGVFLRIGQGANSSGSLAFDASEGVLRSNVDGLTGFVVGRDGGTGTLELANGSSFTVHAGGLQAAGERSGWAPAASAHSTSTARP